jgi:hypothetical protein
MTTKDYKESVDRLNDAFQNIKKVVEVMYLHNKKQAELINLKHAQEKAKKDIHKAYGREIKAGRFVPVGVIRQYIQKRIQFWLHKI